MPFKEERDDSRGYRRDIESVFTELIHLPWGAAARQGGWRPSIDLYETRDSYVLTVDLPGIDPGKVTLSVEGDQLMLCGERSTQFSIESGRFHMLERSSGRFRRTIHLNHRVDPKKIRIDYSSGIYRAHIPKSKQHDIPHGRDDGRD